MKYEKSECSKCKKLIGINNLKKHEFICDGILFVNCKICNKEIIKKRTKESRFFCSLKCNGEYKKVKALDNVSKSNKYNIDFVKELHDFYITGNPLNVCIKKFDLRIKTGKIKKIFLENNLQVRTLKDDGKLFRKLGLYPKQKLREVSTKEYWTKERRILHSRKMIEVAKNNPLVYNDNKQHYKHVKTYLVENILNEVISVRGNYEKKFSMWLNKLNIIFKKPIVGFEYKYKNNTHLYYPDFYLPEYDLWIEIKGRVIERDIFKCKDFKNKLFYLYQNEIKMIDDDRLFFEDILKQLSKYDDYKKQNILRLTNAIR
jgi:hypothetical protein